MAANQYPLGHKQKNTPAQVLQQAQEVGVSLSLANGKLNAAGDRGAVQALAPLLRQYRDDLVGLLREAANDPAQTRPALAPPAYDPGHAALLALAMAYCDRTSASDKARQDWQRDIADTPPELRADLHQHLRAQLPPAPRPAPPAPPAREPAPRAWLDLSQPWRIADRAYLAHWGQCPACKTAATGHTDRCTTGQQLHDAYMAALPTT